MLGSAASVDAMLLNTWQAEGTNVVLHSWPARRQKKHSKLPINCHSKSGND